MLTPYLRVRIRVSRRNVQCKRIILRVVTCRYYINTGNVKDESLHVQGMHNDKIQCNSHTDHHRILRHDLRDTELVHNILDNIS